MNKYKTLVKQIIKMAVIAGVVLALAFGLYVGVSMFGDSVKEEKAKAESALNQQSSLRDSLRQQLDQSGDAEKKYLMLQAQRTNENFTAVAAPMGMKNYLDEMSKRFNLSPNNQVKLSRGTSSEVASEKQLSSNYDVMLQPRLLLEFKAISDLHVFSIIDDMRRTAPGLVRIESVSVSRTGDLNQTAFEQIDSGTTPLMVDAKIEFTWIRIQPKVTKDAKGQPVAGAQPGMTGGQQ